MAEPALTVVDFNAMWGLLDSAQASEMSGMPMGRTFVICRRHSPVDNHPVDEGRALPRFEEVFGPGELAGHRYGEDPRINAFLRRIPEIERDKVQHLWHSRWYDGPLSGMCLYQGKKCWFHSLDWVREGNEVWERVVVIQLSTAEAASIEQAREGYLEDRALNPRPTQDEMIARSDEFDRIVNVGSKPVLAWYKDFVGSPEEWEDESNKGEGQ